MAANTDEVHICENFHLKCHMVFNDCSIRFAERAAIRLPFLSFLHVGNKKLILCLVTLFGTTVNHTHYTHSVRVRVRVTDKTQN